MSIDHLKNVNDFFDIFSPFLYQKTSSEFFRNIYFWVKNFDPFFGPILHILGSNLSKNILFLAQTEVYPSKYFSSAGKKRCYTLTVAPFFWSVIVSFRCVISCCECFFQIQIQMAPNKSVPTQKTIISCWDIITVFTVTWPLVTSRSDKVKGQSGESLMWH